MPPFLWLDALCGGIAMAVALVAPLFDAAKKWTWYAAYYPSMLVALVALAGAVLNFRDLKTRVADDAVEFRFGLFGKSLPLREIDNVEVKKYNWLPYGGWGIRFSWGGRRAWSMIGVPRGVEITAGRDKKARRYFVSSTQPELLASSLAPPPPASATLQ
jgi:hypothetical protein